MSNSPMKVSSNNSAVSSYILLSKQEAESSTPLVYAMKELDWKTRVWLYLKSKTIIFWANPIKKA